MGKAILVTLDNIQLTSGYVTPIMEDTNLRLDYIDQGLLTAVRERMRQADMSLWVEEAWTPSLQRVGDQAIMEAF